MSKELIVSAGRHETRVAILEEDQVVELFHEREKEYSLAGSIHKGRVTRVLPGMQSAFVDIGLERDAFLYVSDFFEDNDEYDAVVSTVEEKILKMEKGVAAVEPARQALPDRVAEPAVVSLTGSAPGADSRVDQRADLRAEHRGEPRAEQRTAPDATRSERERDNNRGGRRGRRRRGGRGSGLPESKFFSPREHSDETRKDDARTDESPEIRPHTQEPQPAPVREAPPARPAYATAHSVSRPAESADDFMVLPGESLAKYAEPEVAPHSWPEPAEPAPPVIQAHKQPFVKEAAPPSFEPALPVEHPLAGLGAASSWATVPPVEEDETPLPTAAERAEDAVSGLAGFADAPEETNDAEEADDAGEAEDADDTEDENEAEDSAPLIEGAAAEADALQADADADIDSIDLTPMDLTSIDLTNETPSGEASEEGPEPARIPTSLTATLREQGHRYPHRVSRRMRRKNRGGQGDEQRPNGEAQAVPEPGNETATVAEAPPQQPLRDNRQRDNNRQQQRPQQGETRTAEAREDKREDRRGDRNRGERTERPERSAERPERERPPLPSIADLLKEGQEIIVQIAKEPLGQKGARITSHIALPGRFVVYMPTVEHVGVSRKIPSDDERLRLKKVLQTHRQGIPGGFICRTAAENKTEEELKHDMHFLYNLWLDMRQKAERKPAPALLHHDLDLVQRVLRDQLTSSFKTIWVDNEERYESILSFVQRFQPLLVNRVKLYTRANPIFDEFGVTNEVEKALRPKVWLKSGGYIVINQTEALVAIDINTGKYVGKSNRLEDTIVKINSDAIKEIVRQIRLRDLGGIIVVDFIDMDERKNRQKVMQALEEAMRADRAPYKILQFNDFGLVAITRKRVKQSLERTLCSPCPYCEAAGYVKSVGTVITEILQEAQRIHKAVEGNDVMLRVNPEVAKVLKSNQNSYLQEIEEILGRTVMVKSDPLLHQTKFDLA